MKELLDFQEKVLIRKHYKDHKLYKLVNQSCKKFEVEMPHLKFSPEEIFLGVVLRLEELRDNPNDASSCIRRLWDELICRYREREGEMPESEVDLAVFTVICFLYICLNTQDESDTIMWAGEVSNLIAEHYGADAQRRLDLIMTDIYQTENGEEDLKEWVSDYLEDTNCVSEAIDKLISVKEDASAMENGKYEFPLDITQSVILFSFLLGEGIACLDTNDSKLADFIGNVTPFLPDSVRTTIGRIKKKKNYKGKLVQDALKISEFLKPLKPQIAKDIEETFAP